MVFSRARVAAEIPSEIVSRGVKIAGEVGSRAVGNERTERGGRKTRLREKRRKRSKTDTVKKEEEEKEGKREDEEEELCGAGRQTGKKKRRQKRRGYC